ncbi:MAG: SAM-dependent methyltransferase [Clostridiaceae bacterium]|nr:SAM-dependent methyltransferase [Clostridiaceae bacterium]
MSEMKSDYRLPERLQAVADLVPPCNCLHDVGTDHAWLPIALMLAERCRRALAIDMNAGPLQAATRNVLTAGLACCIQIIQTDGLKNINLGTDDVVVIAGLGGLEMIRILQEQPRRCKSIVLQPMKSAPELRTWLTENGYIIEKEALVCEPKRYYPVISCRYTGVQTVLSPLERYVGPCLIESRPSGYRGYLAWLRQRLKKQIRGAPELACVIRGIEKIFMSL